MSERKPPRYPGEDAHVDDSLGLDLAAGRLTGPELRAVAEHARRCPRCEAELLAWTGDLERLRAAGVPVRGKDGRFVIPVPPGSRGGPAGAVIPLRGRRWPVLVPAALAAAAGIVLLVLPREGTRRPAEAYWIPPVSEETATRAARSEAGPDLAAGFEAYRNHRAAEAVRKLDGLRAAGDLDLVRRLYLAGALYNVGAAAAAAETLRALDVETLPEPWKDQAEWILALALLENGRDREGTAWLERLARRDGEIGDRARRRLGISPSRP